MEDLFGILSLAINPWSVLPFENIIVVDMKDNTSRYGNIAFISRARSVSIVMLQTKQYVGLAIWAFSTS
jgi:hypothetical protein